MRRLPQNLSLLAVSVMTLSVLAVQPVFAEQGSDDGTTTTISSDSSTSLSDDSGGSSNSGSNTSGSSDSDSGTSGSSNTETRTGGGKGPSGLGIRSGDDNSLHADAAHLLAERRQGRKASTVDERQKACDAHQAEITKRTQNYAAAAQKHLDTFTSIYNKVLAFQDSKQLSASNFNDLKAAADAKQAAAGSAVAVLSSSDVTVDCTSQDPATAVAALKTAVGDARQALQDYRTAIKNMIVALTNAKPSDNSNTSTEGN